MRHFIITEITQAQVTAARLVLDKGQWHSVEPAVRRDKGLFPEFGPLVLRFEFVWRHRVLQSYLMFALPKIVVLRGQIQPEVRSVRSRIVV